MVVMVVVVVMEVVVVVVAAVVSRWMHGYESSNCSSTTNRGGTIV